MSEEVINGDHWEENALIHSFDFDPTGNHLWGADRFPPSLPGRTFLLNLFVTSTLQLRITTAA